MKVLVVHLPPFGTFLGMLAEELLWSTSTQYNCLPYLARAFKSRKDAEATFIKMGSVLPQLARLVEVEAWIDPDFAHIGDCVKAGLPGWNHCCENSLPI